MLFEIPFIVRFIFGLVMLSLLALGGYQMIQTVRDYSGTGQPYIGDADTRCAYPARYVMLKNQKESGRFIPVGRQVSFPGQEAALNSGFRACQN